MTAAAQKFLAETPLKAMLKISPALLHDCAVKAYELCQGGLFTQAEVIARGLVAADHRDWYYRTLLAVTQQKLGRPADARTTLDEGLTFCPAHPELLALRAALG